MCLSVVLAADCELPLIDFDIVAPAFNVGQLKQFETPVRPLLSQSFLYSLGAHTSCGCGFELSEDNDSEDVRRSRRALVGYVETALRLSEVMLFVCWNGEVGTEPRRRLSLRAADLADLDHWLEEGTLTAVTPTE